MEEKYGLVRNNISILERAVAVSPVKYRFKMYQYLARKIEQHFGASKTRQIYEKAISELSDNER